MSREGIAGVRPASSRRYRQAIIRSCRPTSSGSMQRDTRSHRVFAPHTRMMAIRLFHVCPFKVMVTGGRLAPPSASTTRALAVRVLGEQAADLSDEEWVPACPPVHAAGDVGIDRAADDRAQLLLHRGPVKPGQGDQGPSWIASSTSSAAGSTRYRAGRCPPSSLRPVGRSWPNMKRSVDVKCLDGTGLRLADRLTAGSEGVHDLRVDCDRSFASIAAQVKS
jgi:hypothetical protein